MEEKKPMSNTNLSIRDELSACIRVHPWLDFPHDLKRSGEWLQRF